MSTISNTQGTGNGYPISSMANATVDFYKTMDTDGDGGFTAEELGLDDESFAGIDKDGSGRVGFMELVTAKLDVRSAGTDTSSPTSEAAAQAVNFYATKDTDGDGTFTADELGLDETAFSAIDKDDSGMVGYMEIMSAKMENQHINFGKGKPLDGTGLMEQLDADQDGLLNMEEFGANPGMFGLDQNKDGFANLFELNYAGQAKRHHNAGQADEFTNTMFQDMDTNQDGLLDLEEFGSNTAVAELDKDSDGLVSKDEMLMGMLGKIDMLRKGPESLKFIGDKDSDADGVLSSDELGMDEGEFANYDLNQDGIVDQTEVWKSGLKQYGGYSADQTASDLDTTA